MKPNGKVNRPEVYDPRGRGVADLLEIKKIGRNKNSLEV
jgi:hypothetical protein